METFNLPTDDRVTVASLHGAIDHVADVEELIAQMKFPFTSVVAARRLGFLASEMRDLLTDLLRRQPIASLSARRQ